MDPRRFHSLDELEPAARAHLPRGLFTFIAGGAETGAARAGQRAALDAIALRPRVLRDVSRRSQAVSLLGEDHAVPFGIAPMGAMGLCARQADLVVARAAAAEGVRFILSGVSSVPMERIAQAAPGTWMQCYLPADRARIGALMDRVARAGITVLVVTADAPLAPNRDDCLRHGFGVPPKPGPRLVLDALLRPRWLAGTLGALIRDGVPRFENMEAGRGARITGPPAPASRHLRAALCWDDLAWMRARWPGRLVVKGVLDPADAVLVREHGADGIIVSSHGGRQLDHAIAPIRALPGIARVAGDMAVILDGGLRRGTDVLKALALGADFVLLGRPVLYAATVAGEAGVRRAIALLRAEIDRDLALVGRPDIAALGPDCLVPAALDPLAEAAAIRGATLRRPAPIDFEEHPT